MAAGLLVGALAPDASLVTPTLALAFILPILVRGAKDRRMTTQSDETLQST